MNGTVTIPRHLIVLGILLPVALVIGFVLATPDRFGSLAVVGLVAMVLATPVLLRYHHSILVFSWNAGISFFFLPGQPSLWMLMSCVSLAVVVLSYVLNRDTTWQTVPAVTWTLLAFTGVVLLTAYFTGGIGVRALGGSTYGGKKYFHILFAVIGYFALSSQRIPPSKAALYTGIFFLSGITIAFSNLAYVTKQWWLFLIFPVDFVMHQATEDFREGFLNATFSRLSGFSFAGIAVFSFILLRHGIQGVLDLTKPWRLALWLAAIGLSLLGGFRSTLVIMGLIFCAQFYFEGLFRTRLFPVLLLAAVVGAALVLPMTQHLPLSVQRSLSILPVEVNPAARADAVASSQWRLDMWKLLWLEVPKHLIKGKGYAMNPTDLYLTQEATRRGFAKSYENSMVAGDYHSGPLSLLIPFGIFGTLAFVAFTLAGLRVLYANYRHGPPELRLINTFILACFVARYIFYWTVFGAVSSDIALFAGLIALSISLNGGVRRQTDLQDETPA
ncbi:MAG: hypothetical protein JXQ71_04680 [Verrucomicrobia bacterium]|nr:hypothetical protein [Verrucomicrobiota bacterium]